MAAVIASSVGAVILAGIVYDIARLITPDEPRRPPPARLRGRRAALEDAERWPVGLRLHHRVDAATCQRRMSSLAGRRGVLPLPALLATDAPAGAWGLWGAGCIAAALVHAVADTLRDTRAAPGGRQGPAAAGRTS